MCNNLFSIMVQIRIYFYCLPTPTLPRSYRANYHEAKVNNNAAPHHVLYFIIIVMFVLYTTRSRRVSSYNDNKHNVMCVAFYISFRFYKLHLYTESNFNPLTESHDHGQCLCARSSSMRHVAEIKESSTSQRVGKRIVR